MPTQKQYRYFGPIMTAFVALLLCFDQNTNFNPIPLEVQPANGT
jgi:hypothetical protein